MSVEHNKKFVAQFLAKFGRKDIAGALADMSDDCTWWIGG
jgi:ketosteroid isomerase-like protein